MWPVAVPFVTVVPCWLRSCTSTVHWAPRSVGSTFLSLPNAQSWSPGKMGLENVSTHKSPRIDATAAELGKAGVAVQVLRDETGFVDGLEITGQEHHAGEVEFSDHGDHRIFMALALFSLACRNPCSFSSASDTEDSFPGFLDCLGLA
jgi:5-enolpyruvylshikimate-3-phosphate synthase